MNFLKKNVALHCAMVVLFARGAMAKNVPYAEDAYFAQAPQELVALAEKAATVAQFDGDYEIRTPKRPSLEMFPLYAFATKSLNAATNTPAIAVNPAWFLSLQQDEQEFLLTRYFVTFKLGATPTSNTILFILYCLLSILLCIFCFLALRRTRFASRALWMRLLISVGIIIIAELTVLDPVYARLSQHFSMQHEIAIIKKTVEKTGNKDAAIRALEHFDSSIKTAIANGESTLKPYEHAFKQFINELRKNNF